MAELKASQPAQVSSRIDAASNVVKPRMVTTSRIVTPSILSDDTPIQGSPDPVPGGIVTCAGGATMPTGRTGQTIYCNGSRWTSSSLLMNSGSKIGIGESSPQAKLQINDANHADLWLSSPRVASVQVGNPGQTIVSTLSLIGSQNAGVAYSKHQNGVETSSWASGLVNGDDNFHIWDNTNAGGFGSRLSIDQTGNVGLSTLVPQERLDLGGGNIKMGYQIVSNSQSSATGVYAVCPAGKKVISGGCSLSGHNEDGHVPTLQTSKPTLDGARWSCEYNPDQGIFLGEVTATAICANIR